MDIYSFVCINFKLMTIKLYLGDIIYLGEVNEIPMPWVSLFVEDKVKVLIYVIFWYTKELCCNF